MRYLITWALMIAATACLCCYYAGQIRQQERIKEIGYSKEDIQSVNTLIKDEKAELLADLWGITDADLTAKTNIFGE